MSRPRIILLARYLIVGFGWAATKSSSCPVVLMTTSMILVYLDAMALRAAAIVGSMAHLKSSLVLTTCCMNLICLAERGGVSLDLGCGYCLDPYSTGTAWYGEYCSFFGLLCPNLSKVFWMRLGIERSTVQVL